MCTADKSSNTTMSRRVAVTAWDHGDGIIASMLIHGLEALHHVPITISPGSSLPEDIDVLITYGPYGKTLPPVAGGCPERRGLPPGRRPLEYRGNARRVNKKRPPPEVGGRQSG